MPPSDAWAPFTQEPHVARFLQVLELILHPGVYGPRTTVTDDGSPARSRLGPKFLDDLLLDLERGHQAEVTMKATVAPDLGDGEQLDAALTFPAQLGQAGLELGTDLLVLGGGGIAEDAQLAEVDVLAFGECVEMPPEDQRLFGCPPLPTGS